MEPESHHPHAQLIAAELRHAIDRLRNEINAASSAARHRDELVEHRLRLLENQAADYEQRIRSLQESATQFKLLASLSTGGGLLSVIALIKALVSAP